MQQTGDNFSNHGSSVFFNAKSYNVDNLSPTEHSKSGDLPMKVGGDLPAKPIRAESTFQRAKGTLPIEIDQICLSSSSSSSISQKS